MVSHQCLQMLNIVKWNDEEVMHLIELGLIRQHRCLYEVKSAEFNIFEKDAANHIAIIELQTFSLFLAYVE